MKETTYLKKIVLVSVLMGLTVVLKIVGIGTIDHQFRLFAITLLLAGIIGGIPLGLLAGLGADLIYGLAFSSNGFNIIYTIPSLLWGLTGGLIGLTLKKKGQLDLIWWLVYILVMSIVETNCNMLMTYLLYGKGVAGLDLLIKYILLIIKLPIIVASTKTIYSLYDTLTHGVDKNMLK